MKLVFIINSLGAGGAERIVSSIANVMSESEEIYLYTLETDRFYSLNKRVKFHSLSGNNSKTNLFFRFISLPVSLLKFIFAVNKIKPDLVISFLEISNFVNVISSKTLGNKSIISIRTDIMTHYSGGLQSFITKIMMKWLYPLAGKIITLSEGVKLNAIKKYNFNSKKIDVIYNLVDLDQVIKESDKKSNSVDDEFFKDSFVFVNMGRLTEQKGQKFLLRSFKKIVSEENSAKLIILGEGELRSELTELVIKLSLQENVLFLGEQKNPFSILRKCDCFVLSSLWEGFGNVLTEALTLNKPIISTDCDMGPREILCPELKIYEKIGYPYYGSFGVLTKTPLDGNKNNLLEENLLTETMLRFIKEDKLKKDYSNGFERAKDFSKDHTIKKWSDLFHEVSGS